MRKTNVSASSVFKAVSERLEVRGPVFLLGIPKTKWREEMRLHKNGTWTFVSLTTLLALTTTRKMGRGVHNISRNISYVINLIPSHKVSYNLICIYEIVSSQLIVY